MQGPYPVGNPSAQPDLRFAFPAGRRGAGPDLRLIVRPELWGRQARLRFSATPSGAAGDVRRRLRRPAMGGPAVVAGTKRRCVRRPGARHLPPGGRPGGTRSRCPSSAARPAAAGPKAGGQLPRRGRERADDLARQGAADSYVTPPGGGRLGAEEAEAAFPFSTASWFFLDAVDMMAPAGRRGRRLRRHHHRRHALHHERRRPLARRAGAPPARDSATASRW